MTLRRWKGERITECRRSRSGNRLLKALFLVMLAVVLAEVLLYVLWILRLL